MLVNCSERKKPPTSSTSRITRCGVSGRNSAIAASETALSAALAISTRRKPKRRRIGPAANFMSARRVPRRR